jgi:hypothetical protein
MSKASNDWYDKNRSYALNHKRMYRVDNYEKVREIEKKSHLKHKEKRNAYSRNYYYTHPELLEYQKARYHRLKEEKLKNGVLA